MKTETYYTIECIPTSDVATASDNDWYDADSAQYASVQEARKRVQFFLSDNEPTPHTYRIVKHILRSAVMPE